MPISMQTGLQNAKTILHALKIENIPSEIFELQDAMLNGEPNLVEIAQIICKNPELLGDFLCISNQVLHRNPDNLILDAQAAVNILGLKDIERLFLTAYLEKSLPKSKYDCDLIRRSKRAAIAASEMFYWVSEISRAEAYLITFMQDIGALYLSRHHDAFILDHLAEQCALPYGAYSRELQHYQTAHTYLGSLIAHKWHLGDLLSKSILLHHTRTLDNLKSYDIRLAKMVALIQLANALVVTVFAENYETPELIESRENAIEFLELPENAIKAGIAALNKWGINCTEHCASH